jgi:hypothetical protein
MSAPLKLQAVVPIYALSGSPHPDTPPIAAGKAAAIEAENARSPPAGLRRRLPPSRRRFRFWRMERDQHEFFPISDVAVEVTPKRARLRPKIHEEIP